MSTSVSSTFTIEPRGPFSWPLALDVLANFGPIRRHAPRPDEPLRLAFPLDGDFTPVAVALRFDDGRLVGEIAGSADVDAVARQVSRIFSLDVDGSEHPQVGSRTPKSVGSWPSYLAFAPFALPRHTKQRRGR